MHQNDTVRNRMKNSPVFPPILTAHEKYLPPNWMKVDGKGLQVEITSLPAADSAEKAIEMRQIIEFYSRN